MASTKMITLPERYEPGFLASMDRRTDLYRTLLANYEEIVEDSGGEVALAHTMRALIERFVFLEAMLQRLETQIVLEPKKTGTLVNRWIQGVNTLQGLAGRIGIERRLKKTLTLKTYLEAQ
jgi:hypothetical protein